MKPQLKKPVIYSVLFMRDDCGVTRFRMKAVWLKTLVCFLVIISLCAGLAGWGTYYFWKKYKTLQTEHREIERTLSDNRRQLERLANIEKILQSNDVARTSTHMDGVGTENGAVSAVAAVSVVSSTNATRAGSGNATRAGGESAPAALPVTGNATAAPAQGSVTATRSADNGFAATSPDKHPVKIANVTVRGSGNSRIRIAFDLSNQDQSQVLNGRVNLAVVTSSGAIVPVAGADKDDLRFQIARYKRIITTFPVPGETSLADVAAVQVSIDSDGNSAFVDRLPLPTP